MQTQRAGGPSSPSSESARYTTLATAVPSLAHSSLITPHNATHSSYLSECVPLSCIHQFTRSAHATARTGGAHGRGVAGLLLGCFPDENAGLSEAAMRTASSANLECETKQPDGSTAARAARCL